jgi:uncharacterized integral membrane protein
VRYLWAVVALLLAFIAHGFLAQNLDEVSLVYHGFRLPSMPVSLVVILAFAAGFMLALLLGFFSNLSEKVRLRRAEREARRLAGELARRETSRSP